MHAARHTIQLLAFIWFETELRWYVWGCRSTKWKMYNKFRSNIDSQPLMNKFCRCCAYSSTNGDSYGNMLDSLTVRWFSTFLHFLTQMHAALFWWRLTLWIVLTINSIKSMGWVVIENSVCVLHTNYYHYSHFKSTTLMQWSESGRSWSSHTDRGVGLGSNITKWLHGLSFVWYIRDNQG